MVAKRGTQEISGRKSWGSGTGAQSSGQEKLDYVGALNLAPWLFRWRHKKQ
ncbi:hypothetical protein QG37_03577 [Candidozyma auris]|nr:hypothetical protein QG37_03577 [[Candida] auris]